MANIAGEYALALEWIEPAAILTVLGRVPDGPFGARPYEYLIEDLLGEAFARAHRAGARAVKVTGQPSLDCVPVS